VWKLSLPFLKTAKRLKYGFEKRQFALPLTILASVRKQEEKETILLIKEILKMFPGQIVAMFPRHMHRASPWKKLLNSHNVNFRLRSKMFDSNIPHRRELKL